MSDTISDELKERVFAFLDEYHKRGKDIQSADFRLAERFGNYIFPHTWNLIREWGMARLGEWDVLALSERHATSQPAGEVS